MFRVFVNRNKHYDFMTYGEFAAWRLKIAAAGFKPHYSHTVRIRYGDYVYCYQLRKLPERKQEDLQNDS